MNEEQRNRMIEKLTLNWGHYVLAFVVASFVTGLVGGILSEWLSSLLWIITFIATLFGAYKVRHASAAKLSDEQLQIEYDQALAKNRQAQIRGALAAGVALILFATNPDEDTVRKRLGDSILPFSAIQRQNFYLFSIYSVQPPLSSTSKKYIGILNQALRFPEK
jgi:ABC-type xylose transport system permease subunit